MMLSILKNFATTVAISTQLLLVSAHMKLGAPAPKFIVDNSIVNSPAAFCTKVPYTGGPPDQQASKFNKAFSQAGFSTLAEYADRCGSTCGKTDKTYLQPAPADGIVVISDHTSPSHPGPMEIYLDGKMVVKSTGEPHSETNNPPKQNKVDFSSCSDQKPCLLRFVMVGVHESNAQVYDNCVLVGSGGAGSGPGSSSGVDEPSPAPPAEEGSDLKLDEPAPVPSATGPAEENDQKDEPEPVPESADGSVKAQSVSDGAAHSRSGSARSSSASGGAAQYAQCGGQNWSGPTECNAPFSCQVQNPYYSQCL